MKQGFLVRILHIITNTRVTFLKESTKKLILPWYKLPLLKSNFSTNTSTSFPWSSPSCPLEQERKRGPAIRTWERGCKYFHLQFKNDSKPDGGEFDRLHINKLTTLKDLLEYKTRSNSDRSITETEDFVKATLIIVITSGQHDKLNSSDTGCGNTKVLKLPPYTYCTPFLRRVILFKGEGLGESIPCDIKTRAERENIECIEVLSNKEPLIQNN